MPLTQFAIISQRQGNLFWLQSSIAASSGADFSGSAGLPSGFGDCKLYEVCVRIIGAGAGPALVELGVGVVLLDSNTALADPVGAREFIRVSAADLWASVKLTVVRLWRQGDLLGVYTPDLETATNTGSINIFALVERMRQSPWVGM